MTRRFLYILSPIFDSRSRRRPSLPPLLADETHLRRPTNSFVHGEIRKSPVSPPSTRRDSRTSRRHGWVTKQTKKTVLTDSLSQGTEPDVVGDGWDREDVVPRRSFGDTSEAFPLSPPFLSVPSGGWTRGGAEKKEGLFGLLSASGGRPGRTSGSTRRRTVGSRPYRAGDAGLPLGAPAGPTSFRGPDVRPGSFADAELRAGPGGSSSSPAIQRRLPAPPRRPGRLLPHAARAPTGGLRRGPRGGEWTRSGGRPVRAPLAAGRRESRRGNKAEVGAAAPDARDG